jgi:hypothetical protein
MSVIMLNRSVLSRRSFIKGATICVGTGAIYCAMPRAFAEPRDPQTSPFVKNVVRSPANTYFTYPHSNGFMSDGTPVFASPVGDNGTQLEYIACHPERPDQARKLATLSQARTYYSISGNDLLLTTRTNSAVSVLDLTGKSDGAGPISARQIYAEPNYVMSADSDISHDGNYALISSTSYDASKTPTTGQLIIVNISSGQATPIIQNRLVDHGHFSPFDPGWACFCDNAPNNLDRMWVWNQKEAPTGRHLFRQQDSTGGHLTVGHERAMFHKRALLTVAYTYVGTEKISPGLYEVGFDGKARLISASHRDFHCNISRDGTWAVVSLQGVYDPSDVMPPGNWLDVLGTGYGYSDVMLVNMRTGARQFLYRGTNAKTHQPYEVQPTISPDGRWVLLKDAREQRVLMIEIDQQALASFLAG